jgi:hypothetical protein
MEIKEGTSRLELIIYCALQNLLNDKISGIPTPDLEWICEDTDFDPLTKDELRQLVKEYEKRVLRD